MGVAVVPLRDGKFHVYAVSTVDEAMEILADLPAGERGADGEYPQDTINWRVEQKLRHFAERAAEFARPPQPAGEQQPPSGTA